MNQEMTFICNKTKATTNPTIENNTFMRNTLTPVPGKQSIHYIRFHYLKQARTEPEFKVRRTCGNTF